MACILCVPVLDNAVRACIARTASLALLNQTRTETTSKNVEEYGRLIIGCSFHFGQAASRQASLLSAYPELHRRFWEAVRRARLQTTVAGVQAALRQIGMHTALERQEDGNGWVEYWC